MDYALPRLILHSLNLQPGLVSCQGRVLRKNLVNQMPLPHTAARWSRCARRGQTLDVETSAGVEIIAINQLKLEQLDFKGSHDAEAREALSHSWYEQSGIQESFPSIILNRTRPEQSAFRGWTIQILTS